MIFRCAWGEILMCLWRPEGAVILTGVNGTRYLEHIWFPQHHDALHIIQHLLYNKPRFMCAPISTSKMLIIQTKHARWICNTTIERRRLNYISSLSLTCADTMFRTWIMLDGWIESIIIHRTKGGWHGQVCAAYSFLHLSISIVLLVRYKRLGDTKPDNKIIEVGLSLFISVIFCLIHIKDPE